ncbi:MAG: hypothetical protein HYZ73_02320 [Elusimicrobia bacterium]|nr:hypothetical protein [Elusimicrobiota bacterium]
MGALTERSRGLTTVSFLGCLLFGGCYWRYTTASPKSVITVPPTIRRIVIFPFRDVRTNKYHVKHFPAPIEEMQEKLIAHLSQSSRWEVVERDLLTQVMEEQKLHISGAVDEKTAVQIGHLLGSQAIMVGSFLHYGRDPTRVPFATTALTFRVIDVKTAQVLFAKEIEAHNTNMFYPFNNLTASLNQAVRKIAQIMQ